MFVVENKRSRLVQVFAAKVRLKLVTNLANYWNFVLPDDNAIKLNCLDLGVPFMLFQVAD
jgi:hypothetical protein